jgi:hypothetical protein
LKREVLGCFASILVFTDPRFQILALLPKLPERD